jgi:hypothetical protein
MSSEGASAITYDRQLLLLGSKPNVMLDLSEVLRYECHTRGGRGGLKVTSRENVHRQTHVQGVR